MQTKCYTWCRHSDKIVSITQIVEIRLQMSLFGGLAFLVFALLINLNIIRVLHVVVPMQSRFQMQQRFSKSLKYGMVIVQVHRKLTLKVASTNFLVWLLFWTESHQPYTLLRISRHLRISNMRYAKDCIRA